MSELERVKSAIAVAMMLVGGCGGANADLGSKTEAARAEWEASEAAQRDWLEHHQELSPGWAVRFTHAELAARRLDGSPWHVSASDNMPLVIGELAGFAIGNPTLGNSIGKALSKPGGEPLAPAPYVILKIGAATYRIAATERSYAPVWEQPIAVYRGSFASGEPAIIQMIDAVDNSLIGQQTVNVDDLLLRPHQTLTNVGAVASLDIEVEPLPRRSREEYWLTVPSNRRLSSLLRSPPVKWMPLAVWNGDEVTVQATGSVCPSDWSSDCFGPDGVPGKRWRNYNYGGFEDAPHAALVGLLPGRSYTIGARRELRIESSGQLLLFVNDTDVGNNRGDLVAHVIVQPRS